MNKVGFFEPFYSHTLALRQQILYHKFYRLQLPRPCTNRLQPRSALRRLQAGLHVLQHLPALRPQFPVYLIGQDLGVRLGFLAELADDFGDLLGALAEVSSNFLHTILNKTHTIKRTSKMLRFTLQLQITLR